MTELKLFVWNEFSPDYTSGLAFAIAESEDQARKMVIEKLGCDTSDWGDMRKFSLDSPVAFCVSGGG